MKKLLIVQPKYVHRGATEQRFCFSEIWNSLDSIIHSLYRPDQRMPRACYQVDTYYAVFSVLSTRNKFSAADHITVPRYEGLKSIFCKIE